MQTLEQTSLNDTSSDDNKSVSSHRYSQLPEDVLILLPVRNTVLFPGVVAPVGVSDEGAQAAINEASKNGRKIGLLLQRDASDSFAASDSNNYTRQFYGIGTVANIVRQINADGRQHLLCQGEQRFRVLDYLPGFPFLLARVDFIPEPALLNKELEARTLHLQQQTMEMVQLLPQVPAELVNALRSINVPGQLADLVAGLMDIPSTEKQAILELTDIRQRLEKVNELVVHRIEILKLSQQIDKQTKQSLDERQREYVLREQLKTIQKELGMDDDETGDELSELAQAIDAAQMSEEAEQQARKELKRLRKMPEVSGEHGMIRNYLDWLIELPWNKRDQENIDISAARSVLEQDHYGLTKIKQRILEYLAVRKLNPEGRSPILCFVGPPGVGKTSLGQSIARAIGLQFMRISLGGVHDEAEIRGHRRTYIGSMPGNIIQSIHKAGTSNPVFMLDEIDKLGSGGFHGDPAAALLEVLDPEQNNTFRDNYLGIPVDLSKAFFIATANVLDNIPMPLRDRMEIIELPGYTEDEKVQIARRYLIERQLQTNGLQAEQAAITDAALYGIVRDYTREAGCRNLERNIGALLRNVAMRISEGMAARIALDVDDLPDILGSKKFENEVAARTSVPGVATGLAWTPVGGDILFIETTKVPGSGQLILTGQLGEVMKESAQAALSLVKNRADDLGIDLAVFKNIDIHLHVPAGAIPKDGPSAGVAMFMSLASLLTKQTIDSGFAMTGEISLRGLVLPVGGIKEKCLAALRAGIKTVMLPARNRKDLQDIPAQAREQLNFIWLERIDDAISGAIRLKPEYS